MSSDALDASIREAFGRVVYSQKTHEEMVQRLNDTSKIWRWIRLILIVLTTGGAITNIFSRVVNSSLGGTLVTEISTAVVSALALVVTIHQFGVNREKDIEEYKRAANRLWVAREDYINLIADIQDGAITDVDARAKRDMLQSRVAEIYDYSPKTNSKAYEAACKALKVGDQMTFSTKEVDQFLPVKLRKCQRDSS